MAKGQAQKRRAKRMAVAKDGNLKLKAKGKAKTLQAEDRLGGIKAKKKGKFLAGMHDSNKAFHAIPRSLKKMMSLQEAAAKQRGETLPEKKSKSKNKFKGPEFLAAQAAEAAAQKKDGAGEGESSDFSDEDDRPRDERQRPPHGNNRDMGEAPVAAPKAVTKTKEKKKLFLKQKKLKKQLKKLGKDAIQRVEAHPDDAPREDEVGFGETAYQPPKMTLKTRLWNDGTEKDPGQRCKAIFMQQMKAATRRTAQTAEARAEAARQQEIRAVRAQVIDAYRAKRHGNSGATQQSLAALVAAENARANL